MKRPVHEEKRCDRTHELPPAGSAPDTVRSEEVRPGEPSPATLREGVRSGIVSAIQQDMELRGGRTARRLLSAGLSGVIGAVGVTLLVAGHPFGHHPPWHVVMFSAAWAGLLVVTFAIAFLELRTSSWPLARAATVALAGLGLAGLCGALCPQPHFLHWWVETAPGGALAQRGGEALSAFCFGGVSAAFVAVVAAFCFWYRGPQGRRSLLLPAAMLFVLLAPGVILQSFGAAAGVLAGWLAGTAVGGYLGIAGGAALRSGLAPEGT